MGQKITALLLPSVLIAFWQIVSLLGLLNDAVIPSPYRVALAFVAWFVSGDLALDIETSMGRLIVGLVLGVVFGILFGLVSGRSRGLDEIFSPFLNIIRSFPAVAIIPLVIVLFGIGDGAKIFSISFAVFFPVWIAAYEGAKRVPVEYLRAALLLSPSKWERFTKVVFPAVLPYIVSGIRIGIALAFIMVFVSELSGASSGL